MRQWQTQLEQLQRDHRVPLIIGGCFVVILLFSLSHFISTFKATHQTITIIKKPITTVPPLQLENLHLMGKSLLTPTNVPISTSQFGLAGTIVVPANPAQSRAIISTQNGQSKVYKMNDSLAQNITIKQIEKDQVIIDNAGTLEKIILPQDSLFATGEQ